MIARSIIVRRGVKLVFHTTAWLAGLVAAFLIAAVIGTVWTAPPQPDGGAKAHTIYILSNGYHTDIALAVDIAAGSSALPVAAADFPNGLSSARYLLFGWGSEAAYTSLLSLTDLSAGTILTALSFDRSVVHVVPIHGAPEGQGVYRLDLGDDQFRRLTAFIAATFVTDDSGRAELVADASHGYGDIFYRAAPRFSAFYGCNAWTGEALRIAGVQMGRWTPFAQSVEWSLSR